jgi:hypothetical protein
MGKPLWRQGVDTIDELVAPVLGDVVSHEAFGLTVAVLTRIHRTVGDRAERLSRQVLHAVNLPAGSDVTRVLLRLASVERELRELGHALDDARLADSPPVRHTEGGDRGAARSGIGQ